VKTYSLGGAKSIAVYDAASNCLPSADKQTKIIIISVHCNMIG